MDNSIYRDVYNLHSECLVRLNESDYWNIVFWPKAEALTEKHHHNVFLMEMIIAVHGELERQWRKQQKEIRHPLPGEESSK